MTQALFEYLKDDGFAGGQRRGKSLTFAIVRGEFCGLIFSDKVWFDWGCLFDGSKDVSRPIFLS